MFDRKDVLGLDGFEGAGADWMQQYKRDIEDGKIIAPSPQ